MRFNQIPENTFQDMQLEVGVLLKNFDPATGEFYDDDIICATTGGITVTAEPTYSDLGEDVDNAPTNTKELKHLDGWNCTIATTCLGTSPRLIRMALGAADINAEMGKVTPRRNLKQTDFADIWHVCDKADGGMVATRLINALSTGGLSLQTTKNGKGQIALTLTGHVSIKDQDTMPIEFYSTEGEPVPMSADIASIPAQTENAIAGDESKKVSDLITKDTIVTEDGEVIGTLKHVDGFTGFSSNAKEQTGNFFPIKIAQKGNTVTVLKNGKAVHNKIPYDPDFVFRVEQPTDTFEIRVDGDAVVRLGFDKATLEKATK